MKTHSVNIFLVNANHQAPARNCPCKDEWDPFLPPLPPPRSASCTQEDRDQMCTVWTEFCGGTEEGMISGGGKSAKTWLKLAVQGKKGEQRTPGRGIGMKTEAGIGRSEQRALVTEGNSRPWDGTVNCGQITKVSDHVHVSKSKEKSMKNFKEENVNNQIYRKFIIWDDGRLDDR